MTGKRHHNVMLRLTAEEHDRLAAAKPPGEELAVFARRSLLSAVGQPTGDPALRRAAAFIVAALAPDIGFDEALTLYDDHAGASREVARGRD